MFCHKCGTQLPVDAAFCHKCGAATIKIEEYSNTSAPPPQSTVTYYSAKSNFASKPTQTRGEHSSPANSMANNSQTLIQPKTIIMALGIVVVVLIILLIVIVSNTSNSDNRSVGFDTDIRSSLAETNENGRLSGLDTDIDIRSGLAETSENGRLSGLDMDVWSSIEEKARREVPTDPNTKLVGIWQNIDEEIVFLPDGTGSITFLHSSERIEFSWDLDYADLTMKGEGIDFQGGTLILSRNGGELHLHDYEAWTSVTYYRFRHPSKFLLNEWSGNVIMYNFPDHPITSTVPDLLAFITNGEEISSYSNISRIGANFTYPSLLSINYYATTIDVNDPDIMDRMQGYPDFLRLLGWERGVIPADPADATTDDMLVLVKDGVFVALMSMGSDETGLFRGVVAMDIGPYPWTRR